MDRPIICSDRGECLLPQDSELCIMQIFEYPSLMLASTPDAETLLVHPHILAAYASIFLPILS